MTQRAIDGDYIYFVTANVRHRRWFFVTLERAAVLAQTIVTCCRLKTFDFLAYCILPNHIHLLVRKLREDEAWSAKTEPQRTLGSVRCGGDLSPTAFLFQHRRRPRRRSPVVRCYTLSDLMHSIKSTFSHALKQGKFWQHRSNFRIIETEEYLTNVVEYIRYNYQKMGLPEQYGQLPFVRIDASAIQRVFDDQKRSGLF